MLRPKWLTGRLLSLSLVLGTAVLAAVGVRLGLGVGRRPHTLQIHDDPNIELVAYQARPTLEGGVGWINTAGPIHLEQLRGKVVLLDFWTFCCINCHHVLPDLAYLEQKYKNELVVIGVHSAKFDAERDTDNIRKKVAEYRIKHPVVNDANMTIWRRFGVNSWPTLVVLDANGNYVDQISGEGHRAALDEFLGKLIAQHKALREIDETPITFFPESEKPHEGNLLYPGKVTADAAGGRLFIADTGNNRIVVTNLSGKVQKVVGTGEEGLVDGAFDHARFNRPQGLCLVGDILYVADTENHVIRAVDLKAERVEVVAGTGRQTHTLVRQADALKTGLNSPWDVLAVPGTKRLAIAMAGQHQIWQFDPEHQKVGVWAGSGREGIVDGPLLRSELAQPSGLATDGRALYIADSEASAIRALPLGHGEGHVETVIGVEGGNLFNFGDEDGRGESARLQHCLGVAFGGGKLYVADTYNNKIKVCDPKTRSIETLAGSHRAGDGDDPPLFSEPGGLSVAGSTLYVADTNNHKIRTVDLSSGKVGTLAIDVGPPSRPKRRPSFPNAVAITAPAAQVAPGDHVEVEVALTLPRGFKLNPDAPMPYVVEAPADPKALAADAPTQGAEVEPPSDHFTIKVPLAKPAQAGDSLSLKVSLGTFICKGGAEGLCTVKSVVWTVPLTFAEGAPERVKLTNEKGPASRK